MAIAADTSSDGPLASLPNGTANGDVQSNGGGALATAVDKKKARESERRRGRRKQKKNNKASSVRDGGEDSDEGNDKGGAKENSDPQKTAEQVEVEYVPEKAKLEDYFIEDFKKVFEKFTFSDVASGAEDRDKKDEDDKSAATKMKVNSDSE